jgi:hypothetical protein
VAETLEQAKALGEARRAEAQVESALTEIERLQENQYIIQNRIDATPRVAEQLEALEREYAQLHLSLNDFSQRRTEAMVQANLERRQLGEKFRILEAAFPPIEVSWPNRWVMIPMGLVVGLALGLGLAVVLEVVDSSFHSESEVQSVLDVPVLASIPNIEFDFDLAQHKRDARRSVGLAALAVAVTIVGGGGSYWYMNGLPGWLLPTAEESTEESEASLPRAPWSVAAAKELDGGAG